MEVKMKLSKLGFWLWLPVRFICWCLLWIIRILMTGITFIGYGYWAAKERWDDLELGI
jgi:hypothetical protein